MEKHARSIMLRACFLGVGLMLLKQLNRFSRTCNHSGTIPIITSIARNLYFPIIAKCRRNTSRIKKSNNRN